MKLNDWQALGQQTQEASLHPYTESLFGDE
jgi:hypothetical protein